ncbi:MAG: phage tail tape measure protein, partial [Acidaminococcaceae bacterium]
MKVIDATIRLIDRFTPTLKNINKQIEQQQRANESMAKSVQQTGKAMQGLGEKLLPVSAAAVAFGAYGVKAFGDFEQAMNKVKVKLDESDWGRFDELKEQAKQLSTQYAYSAAEIAEAQENIVAAGWNVNAVLSATPTVMNLAAAAGVDMATASSILTDNMTAFGIAAEEANGFADMLAVTANATNTSIPAMAESYKYCASAARAMGVDLADTSALIGMLANSGIKGSEAGTSVKDMLERLAIPAHRAELEALGVVVKDTNGNFVGMRSVLDQTRNAMQGMDQLQKMEIIKEAFGSTA